MSFRWIGGHFSYRPVLRPDDPAYDGARRVWNTMVERRPRMIAEARRPRPGRRKAAYT
jgi:hypothetical protein